MLWHSALCCAAARLPTSPRMAWAPRAASSWCRCGSAREVWLRGGTPVCSRGPGCRSVAGSGGRLLQAGWRLCGASQLCSRAPPSTASKRLHTHPPTAAIPGLQALTSNSGLQSLLLDTNALGDEGAAMLATVRSCPALLTGLCPVHQTMPCTFVPVSVCVPAQSRGTAALPGWAAAAGSCFWPPGSLLASLPGLGPWVTPGASGRQLRHHPQWCAAPAPPHLHALHPCCPATDAGAGGRQPYHHPQPLF